MSLVVGMGGLCSDALRSFLTLDTLALILWGALVGVLNSQLKPHQRPFPGETIALDGETLLFVRDSRLIELYKSTWEQACPSPVLAVICIFVPLAALALGVKVRRRAADVPAFVHGWLLSWTCETVVVDLIKNYCGVYRPYFYDECGYDEAPRSCTSEHHDARRSFPSGHAGLARALRLVCAACYMMYPSCGMAYVVLPFWHVKHTEAAVYHRRDPGPKESAR